MGRKSGCRLGKRILIPRDALNRLMRPAEGAQ